MNTLRDFRTYLITFLALPVLLGSVGCKRPDDGISRLSIRIPTVQQMGKSKASAQGVTIDYNLLCIYINVKGGPGIDTLGRSCQFDRGLVQGGAPGQTIEMDLPSGTGRTVEAWGFLRTASTETCQPFSDSLKLTPSRTYLLDTAENVDTSSATTQVTMTFTIPTSEQNLMATRGWTAATCPDFVAPRLSDHDLGKIQNGAAKLIGSQFHMSAQVSHQQDGNTLSGTQFKMKSWIKKE